ncbi:MAG: hypothetical protein NWF10_05180 [Candidatus Bathyarchaeota archaeon]|nr:hypothetical protein [Candidatus Bathyarchaeota archaeon]
MRREISPLDSCTNPIGGATQLSITEKKFLDAVPSIGLRTKTLACYHLLKINSYL